VLACDPEFDHRIGPLDRQRAADLVEAANTYTFVFEEVES